jgi:hypothetical protein
MTVAPSAPAAGEAKRRRVAFVVLVLSTIVYAVSLPFAVVVALMSPIAFRAGASPASWAYLGGALGYLLLVVVTLVLAWVLYRRRRHRACLVVLLLPLVGAPILAVVAALALGR